MATNTLMKLNNAAGQDELIQLVSFSLDGEEYGVEVLKVREIIRVPVITTMPNSARHIEGIINLRGKVLPIVSMRKRFALRDCENDSHTRIIIMDVDGSQIGFVVDGVSEVIRISGSEIQPSPVLSGGVSQDFITGVFNHGERLLIIMDVERMFTDSESASLSGM